MEGMGGNVKFAKEKAGIAPISGWIRLCEVGALDISFRSG